MQNVENIGVIPKPVCSTCGKAVPSDAPEGLCPNCLLQSGFRTPESNAGQPSTSGYGTPFVAPEPKNLAEHFPQLEILELLGQGGMGAVYKARQKKLDRLVALKILPLESGNTPAFAERFNREAKALARLSHANIIAIHDYGEAGGLFYFIMEYVDGRNLRQLMLQRQLAPRDSLELVPQICEALQYAHDEGVVHRDIKPENIMIDRRGRVKIADFGLAKLLHAHPTDFALTGSRQMMGTPHYMAPEQMERPLEVDHRADIFSLGVVFYELLTSELPLGRFAPPSQKVRIDRRLDDIVLRALTKEPEHRYQRVSEIKYAVEAVARGTPAQPAESAVEPRVPEVELLRLEVQGATAGLFVTGVLAAFSWIIILSVWPVRRHYYYEYSGRGWEYTSMLDEYPGIGVLAMLPVAVLFFGAWCMRRLRAYDFSITSCILAILPWSPAVVVGLPMGIRGLMLLKRRDVRAAFAVTANPASKALEWAAFHQPAVEHRSPSTPAPGKVQAFLNSVRNYLFTSAPSQIDPPAGGPHVSPFQRRD
jgi:serine/threonine protein kinase